MTDEIILECKANGDEGPWHLCGDQEEAWLNLAECYDDYETLVHGMNEGHQFEAYGFLYRKFRVVENLLLF